MEDDSSWYVIGDADKVIPPRHPAQVCDARQVEDLPRSRRRPSKHDRAPGSNRDCDPRRGKRRFALADNVGTATRRRPADIALSQLDQPHLAGLRSPTTSDVSVFLRRVAAIQKAEHIADLVGQNADRRRLAETGLKSRSFERLAVKGALGVTLICVSIRVD